MKENKTIEEILKDFDKKFVEFPNGIGLMGANIKEIKDFIKVAIKQFI